MRMTNRIAAFASAALLASGILLAGCSSEENNVTDPDYITSYDIDAQDIEVTSVGYQVNADGLVTYGFTALNPNDDYVGQSVMFSIEGFDADGNMLVGTATTAQQLYPGVEVALGGYAPIMGEGELVDFQVSVNTQFVAWEKTDVNADEIKNMYSTSDVSYERDAETGSVIITGTATARIVASADSTPFGSNAEVSVLLLGPDGSILEGASSDNVVFDNLADGDPEANDGQLTDVSTTFRITVANAPDFSELSIFMQPSM